MSHTTTTLDRPRFALLDRLAQRLHESPALTPSVRAAIDTLTADADPERASRLALGATEPPVLAERLAVWALHRAGDDAVVRASRHLDVGDRPTRIPRSRPARRLSA